MARYPWRFLLVALAAAWSADFLFWGKPLGISFLLWAVVVIGGAFWLSAGENQRFARRNWALVAAVFLLVGSVFIRLEPFTQATSFLLGLLLIFLLSAVFLNGHWVAYRVVDYLSAAFRAFIAAFARPQDLTQPAAATASGAEQGFTRAIRRIFPVLRGLLLAVPVVLVLGTLLASADLIFSDWISAWVAYLAERILEYLLRGFIILALAYLFSGLYLFAIRPDQDRPQPDPNKAVIRGFLGWVEAAVVLVSVNVLFAVFLVFQFRYFFGGAANIHAAGYTFAEYARRGFGELVAVAVLSLLLYLGLGAITRTERRAARTGFTILSVGLILQVVVMLISAFQRLLLYENAYGFTRMRTYAHVFMVWLGLLLGLLMVLEVFRQRGRFALALLAAVFGFCLTLPLLNVDSLVVHQNVARAADHALDSEYLQILSADAVPAMAAHFGSVNDPATRDVLGAELACRAAMMSSESRPWQGFSWSWQNARRTLAGMQAELQDYPVALTEDEWQVQVQGETQPCRDLARAGWD